VYSSPLFWFIIKYMRKTMEYKRSKDYRNRRIWKWPYDSIEDPQYIKDKEKLFEENMHGWFVYSGLKGDEVPKRYRYSNGGH